MPKVPTDVVLLVVQYSIWELETCPKTSQPNLVKQGFQKGVANASKIYRGIYMFEWYRCLTLHKADDWKFATNNGFAGNVRELIIQENALLSHSIVKANLDFSRFDLIHTLSLDCHRDVGYSASKGTKEQWSYKKIIPSLPRKLKSLTILNAHGPDLQVIQKAIKQCKDLECLTLGRCTKFNRPNDSCQFWKDFPNDHDSYFSGQGVDGYANALAIELQGLPNLKFIFVNVYLTDTKYLNVRSSTTGPILQAPQPPSVDLITVATKLTPNGTTQAQTLTTINSNPVQIEQDGTESKDLKDTEEAERIAAKILFDSHPSLEIVGFISYWSKDHLGWSTQERRDIYKANSLGSGGKCDGASAVELFQSI